MQNRNHFILVSTELDEQAQSWPNRSKKFPKVGLVEAALPFVRPFVLACLGWLLGCPPRLPHASKYCTTKYTRNETGDTALAHHRRLLTSNLLKGVMSSRSGSNSPRHRNREYTNRQVHKKWFRARHGAVCPHQHTKVVVRSSAFPSWEHAAPGGRVEPRNI